MRITKEIKINDEPWISASTGKRKATLAYIGPRYVYLEYDTNFKRVEAVAHISESEPDSEAALEKLTDIEGRVMIEIDADKTPIIAAHFWNVYKLEVSDYEEVLSNGETYKYDYSSDPQLGAIFDFNNMELDPETKDYKEYKFVLAPMSDSDMLESVDTVIEKITNAIDTNIGLTEQQKTELQQYINELNQYKAHIADGIENWKIAFPVCNIPY